MAKLEKSTFPSGHGPNDFQCFGPPAMEDGKFSGCKMADMGSFSQDDKDSNKYYTAQVCKSRKTGIWYAYFEWGRVGAKSPQFQFEEHPSEDSAQRSFEEQCHSKNDKRGVWTTIAGLPTLTAKPGKDVYLVRELTTRSTGLPDAKTIKFVESNAPVAPTKATAVISKPESVDRETSTLLRDLIGGTISYTRSSMADNSLPTFNSITQARTIITEAQKRLVHIGEDLDEQIADKELRNYSSELYRRIPKIKPVGTPDSVWILSRNNMLSWQQDLDAFESALKGQAQVDTNTVDPYMGLPISMNWINPNTELGKFLYQWWPNASANKHRGVGNMKIKNMWKVERHGDEERFVVKQSKIQKELTGKKIVERPLFQPKDRLDLSSKQKEIYGMTNTCLLLHGTRTNSVSGILRENFRQPKDLPAVLITGAMFSSSGSGTYFADDWRKSAGYTSMRGSYWSSGSGGVANRDAFMFGCEAIVGQPHVALKSHPYSGPPKETHCVFGMGRNHPSASGKSGAVENNEWIVFDISQIRIKYLVEFST